VYCAWLSDSSFLVSKKISRGDDISQEFQVESLDENSWSLVKFKMKHTVILQPLFVGSQQLLVAVSGRYQEVNQLCISKIGMAQIPPDSRENLTKEEFFDIYTMPGNILGWVPSPDENFILINIRKYLHNDEELLEILSKYKTPQISPNFDLILFNLTTRQIEHTYSGHIAYSPSSSPFIVWPEFGWNNLFFLTGSEDGNVFIFHRDSEQPIKVFRAHEKLVNQIVFHPKKDILVSVSDDCSVRMWVPKMMVTNKVVTKETNHMGDEDAVGDENGVGDEDAL